MGFKKEDKCLNYAACPLLKSEEKSKQIVCDQLSLITDFLFLADEFTKDYLANMKQLKFETEYNLYKSLKELDPEFPWEDPFYEAGSEEEEYLGAGMYEILKECIEFENQNK